MEGCRYFSWLVLLVAVPIGACLCRPRSRNHCRTTSSSSGDVLISGDLSDSGEKSGRGRENSSSTDEEDDEEKDASSDETSEATSDSEVQYRTPNRKQIKLRPRQGFSTTTSVFVILSLKISQYFFIALFYYFIGFLLLRQL